MATGAVLNSKWFLSDDLRLGVYTLAGGKCGSCGGLWFPVRMACPSCGGTLITEVPLSDSGRLYTFTWIHAGFQAFGPPYAIGYVDLPEGLRVFSLIKPGSRDLRVGMPVKMIIEPLNAEDGRLTYKFAPAEES
ncbi:MAG: OB-fold domain-containing protein [Actinobacteria bacterium]|nr:OB-fold domain-containing protein [Actinomycetota bacterium]